MKHGWQTRKFGDICELKKGKKPTLTSAHTSGLKPYLVAKYLRGGEPTDFALISDKNSIQVGKHEIIIICDGSNSGETFIGFDGVLSSTMAKIAHGPDLDNKFLMHFLDSLFEKFNASKTGAAIPHLDLAALREQTLPFPPLPEQQRIVAILDAAFDGIVTAKANFEANLQNARALFESHLQSIFTERGEGWKKKTLKELTTILGDGLHGTPKYTDDGDYYFINGNNLTAGVIEFKDNTKRVSVDEFNKHKKNLTDRTILVSINGTLGNVAFYNGEKVILGKSACYFNLKDGVDKNFVKCVFSSPYFLEYAHKEATGATIKNVSLKTMREFEVPLPPLAEQQRIADKLDTLRAETQRLESLYQRKLATLDALKKSLLHQAFSGAL